MSNLNETKKKVAAKETDYSHRETGWANNSENVLNI